MGRPKHMLPFGEETLLQRVARTLGTVVPSITVVAARDQPLPELDSHIQIARDDYADYGPLGGLYSGLKLAAESCEIVFASAVDAPLLRGEFVQAMLDAVGENDVAICQDEKYYYPLAAAYRTNLWTKIESLIQADQRRLIALLDQCQARILGLDELRTADPNLDSLRNTNTKEDYHAALEEAGHEIPRDSP